MTIILIIVVESLSTLLRNGAGCSLITREKKTFSEKKKGLKNKGILHSSLLLVSNYSPTKGWTLLVVPDEHANNRSLTRVRR